jgi:hypothetical protein
VPSGTPETLVARPAMALPRPPATIVPLYGLPVVACVFALLVAATAEDSVWALNLFHVAGGGLWTAIDLFVGLVIGPILGRMSVPARAELASRLLPAMALIMPTLAVSTLVSGWQLADRYGYLDSGFVHHGWIVASFVVVAVMATVALGVNEPANVAVLFELRRPQPRGEVIEWLMRRFAYSAGITGLMQVSTIVIMTYLRAPL